MKSSRLLALPPYLFEELERKRDQAISQGRDVIDLSVGDPDIEPPSDLVASLKASIESGRHHHYPAQRGAPGIKAAIRRFLSRHYGVAPKDDEILILVGSKEGICHLSLAVCDPGHTVLVPDPGYPVYAASALFAGCRVVSWPLFEEEGFLPRFRSLAPEDLSRAKLCFINYPNNPTGATAPEEFLDETLDFADSRGIILANDAAYSEVYFGSGKPAVLVARPGALGRNAIEFYSFSKMFCITGWRIGFAVGHREIIEALAHLKANVDSGVFGAIQEAVAKTLDGTGDDFAERLRGIYRERRDRALSILAELGFKCFSSCATFYLWVRVPAPWNSMDYALMLLEEAGVLVTPGVGFGEGGEGFFRIALTCPLERLEEVRYRMGRLGNPPGSRGGRGKERRIV